MKHGVTRMQEDCFYGNLPYHESCLSSFVKNILYFQANIYVMELEVSKENIANGIMYNACK